MSGSTITGLGSGLDINALVKVMADAQRAPKEAQLERQASRADTQLSAVGMLKNALSTFESSLSSLSKSATSFAGLQVSSSESKTATATLTEGAVGGTYALEVKSLATASKVATAVQAKDAKFESGGMLKIEVGLASYSVNVEAGATLAEIRELINEKWSASSGLTANIVSDEKGDRLVLSSDKTGEGNDISISGDLAALNVDGSVALDAEDNTSGAGYITPAANAVYTLDGLEMTSAENKATGLSGVSIELKEVGKTTLSVSANTSGLSASVESFVMAYNTLLTVTNGLTKVTTNEGDGSTQAGALVADASLRSLMSSLRGALVSPVAGGEGVNMLGQLGISTSKDDGKLVVDSAALKAAVADNPDGIKAFFTGDNGMLKRVADISSVYSKSGGLLESRETSLKTTLTDLASEKADLKLRIEKLTTSLFKKFNAMDTLVARLNATSQSVLATLNALNKRKDD